MPQVSLIAIMVVTIPRHQEDCKVDMVKFLQFSQEWRNVSVNSNCGHPPPGNPQAFDFLEHFGSNVRVCRQKSQSNVPPVRLCNISEKTQ